MNTKNNADVNEYSQGETNVTKIPESVTENPALGDRQDELKDRFLGSDRDSDNSQVMDGHKVSCEQYKLVIGARDSDYNLLRCDCKLSHLLADTVDLDDFQLIHIKLSEELNRVQAKWTDKMRAVKRVVEPAEAQKLFVECKLYLQNYMSIRRKVIGCAALYSENEKNSIMWVSFSELEKFGHTRQRMSEQWKEIKHRLLAIGKFRDLNDTLASSQHNAALREKSEFSIPDKNSSFETSRQEFRNSNIELERIQTPRCVSSCDRGDVEDPRKPLSRQPLYHGIPTYPPRAWQTGIDQSATVAQLTELVAKLINSQSHNSPNYFRTVRKELPKFGGEITEFKTWYISYKRYVEQDCDDDFVKLLSLKELLVGEAADKVFASLPMAAESYPQALNKLIHLYDSPALIERGYYNRLDKIITPSYRDLKGMRAVYDEILAIITAMKCSRRNIGILLKVESKFPPEILREIGRRSSGEETERDLQLFLEAADSELKSLEKVERIHNLLEEEDSENEYESEE